MAALSWWSQAVVADYDELVQWVNKAALDAKWTEKISDPIFVLNVPPTMKTRCDNNDRESPGMQRLLRSVCSPSCRQATWPDDRQPCKSQRRSSSQFDSHALIVKKKKSCCFLKSYWHSVKFPLYCMSNFDPRQLHWSIIDTTAPAAVMTPDKQQTVHKVQNHVRCFVWSADNRNPVSTHSNNSKVNAS